MKSRKAVALPPMLAVASIAALLAQMTPATADTASDVASQQQPAHVVWETLTPSGDSMASVSKSEVSQTRTLRGQMWYVPTSPSASRTPLYRLRHNNDRMPSLSYGEGPYVVEGSLGYPWLSASSAPGTQMMFRGYDPSSGDHALLSPYADLGYPIREYMGAYAYPRFGAGSPRLVALHGNNMGITSNEVAGGQVWDLNWNGKQFLSHTDYGRGIQSSLAFATTAALPTEGGSQGSHPDERYMFGSPLLSIYNELSSGKKSQTSAAVPSEWNRGAFGGNDSTTVLYPQWRLGKTITLDDPAVDLGPDAASGQVARYQTRFAHPTDLFDARIEIPTVYLTPDFNRSFIFDARKDDINAGQTEIAPSQFQYVGDQTWHKEFSLPELKDGGFSGGVIQATQNLQYAIGIYGSRRSANQYSLPPSDPNGSSVSYFDMKRFGSNSSPSVVKITAAMNGTLPAGEQTFNTFICVGTYDQVRVQMRRLYLKGHR